MEKISWKKFRRVYKSVEDKSLTHWDISQLSTDNRIHAAKD